MPANPTPSPATKKAVKPIPDGASRVSPYLIVKDAARLIEFTKRVLGAKEVIRMPGPDGKVMHGEVAIGDCVVMFGEAGDAHPAGSTMLYVYVDDVDATYQKALAQGATSAIAPVDQFYGDRNAAVKDHSGNQWWFARHVEDVTPEEMQRRAAEHMKNQKK
jgi:PhnB protein